MKIVSVFGPPGTGKTSHLTKSAANAVARYQDRNVLAIASLTKTAAHEIAGRNTNVNPAQIGTLHALCFRQMGHPEVWTKHVEEWNRDHLEFSMGDTKEHHPENDIPVGEMTYEGNGGELLEQLSLYRHRMVPPDLWLPRVQHFSNVWTQWKEENDFIDFDDMIWSGLHDFDEPPFGVQIGIVDEAQDFSRLEWALLKHWAEKMHFLMVAGDDDQASPPGTKVLTNTGEVCIENLDPHRHALTSWSVSGSQLLGCVKKGYEFQIAPSSYEGDLHTLNVGSFKTSVTHNHPCLFRWSAAAQDKWVVYLMHKEGWWRIGQAKLIRADGTTHFTHRCYQEGADAAWILTVCASKPLAYLWEQYASIHFGLAQTLWNPLLGQTRTCYTKEHVAQLFALLGDQNERAYRCLAEFGRQLQHPFYVKNGHTRHGSVNYTTAACNLLPEVMDVPVVQEIAREGVRWIPLTSVEKTPYTGLVYGINVPPHHTYIADNIVTHNCLYAWRGASVAEFVHMDPPPAELKVLDESYRLPRSVWEFCERWVRQISDRQPKVYRPKPEPGAVRLVPATYLNPEPLLHIIEDCLKHNRTMMILAACKYQLTATLHMLRGHGVPFSNTWRTATPEWNPLAKMKGKITMPERMGAYLAPSARFESLWTEQELKTWLPCLAATGYLQKGAHDRVKEWAKSDRIVSIETLKSLFVEKVWEEAMAGDPYWLVNRALKTPAKKLQYPAAIATHRGVEVLDETPLITLGTIHSVKGGASQVVAVFPDISPAGYNEWTDFGTPRDGVLRQFYVAVSRASETLILCEPATARAVDWKL